LPILNTYTFGFTITLG